jgi:hypothetical protein
MSKPDALRAQTIPVGILVSAGPRSKAPKPPPRRKTTRHAPEAQVPWPWIAAGGGACLALLMFVVAVCTAGQRPAQAVKPAAPIAALPQAIEEAAPEPAPQDNLAPEPAPEDKPAPVPLELEKVAADLKPPQAPEANDAPKLRRIAIKEEAIILLEVPPVKEEVVKPKRPVFRDDVDLAVYASCKQIGSNVLFLKDPPEAFRRARAEKKLVFIVHLSGNLEDPDFT